jgi:hypothetical protein
VGQWCPGGVTLLRQDGHPDPAAAARLLMALRAGCVFSLGFEEDPAGPGSTSRPATALPGSGNHAPVLDRSFEFPERVRLSPLLPGGRTGPGLPGTGAQLRCSFGNAVPAEGRDGVACLAARLA